jgi:hypothetical protein
MRRRSRKLALGLLDIGVDSQDAEAQLLRWARTRRSPMRRQSGPCTA